MQDSGKKNTDNETLIYIIFQDDHINLDVKLKNGKS